MAIFGDIETVKEQINDSKFDKAFLYIKKLQDKNSDEYKSLANIELDKCNKIEIDENCFVLEQAYLSKNKEDCFFESHKKYIDIQYIFEGEEIMEVENIKNLVITNKYDSQLDFAKYSQTPKSSILKIRKNELAIFYPKDGHMPCIKIDNNIKKKIFDGLTKVVHTDKSGKPMNELNKMQSEDPMFLPRLYYVAKILNWDLSKHKSSETKILNDLKGKMNSYPSNKDIDSTILKLRKAIKKNSNSLF